MTTPLDIPDVIDRTLEQRKVLGQFFTGPVLGSLLAYLARRPGITSVIDPMCGSGDLLAATLKAIPDAHLTGIDIDPTAIALATQRFEGASNRPLLVAADAFEPCTLDPAGRVFDLVITNPPYVRYQALSNPKAHKGVPQLPSMSKIRANLLCSLDLCTHLGEEERHLFRLLIKNYSGLSDLAVPSWILCSMLLQPGGTLALVAPETWLSRDYARPVQYLLHKLFRLRFIVEDEARCWFPEAQVKTTLMVAERVPPIEIQRDQEVSSAWIRAVVPKGAGSPGSVVGDLYPGPNPEQAFAEAAKRLLSVPGAETPSSVFSRHSKKPLLDALVSRAGTEAWFRQAEPNYATPSGKIRGTFPVPLASALPELDPEDFVALVETGYSVGQGLRTGANEFFYWTLQEDLGREGILQSGGILNMKARLPHGLTATVLRRQSELNGSFAVNPADLHGRVLVLGHLISNTERTFLQGQFPFSSEGTQIPADLSTAIARAATKNIGSTEAPKFIPRLSAVRTNEISGRRAWYMLPPFSKRHLPDLFVPRVNAREPRTILNSIPPVVVDANFTTLWRAGEGAPSPQALLAFLHSCWALVGMELEGVVMGGGALKLEATHVRRLLVPVRLRERWAVLHDLGGKLARVRVGSPGAQCCLDEIDRTVIGAFADSDRLDHYVQELRDMLRHRVEVRTTK